MAVKDSLVSTEYTVDRHIALLLVARDRIAVRDSEPCRRDGGDLPAGVFTAVIMLEQDGLVASRSEQIEPKGQYARALLTVSGVQQLTRFDQEHGRPSQGPALTAKWAEMLGVG